MHKRGFTLLELLIAVAILAALASVGITVFARVLQDARESSCRATISRIGRVAEAYWTRYAKPPESIDDLSNCKPPFFKIEPKCPYSGVNSYRIVPDKEYGFRVECSAHDPQKHNVNAEAKE